jgi:hypothetical protein
MARSLAELAKNLGAFIWNIESVLDEFNLAIFSVSRVEGYRNPGVELPAEVFEFVARM